MSAIYILGFLCLFAVVVNSTDEQVPDETVADETVADETVADETVADESSRWPWRRFFHGRWGGLGGGRLGDRWRNGWGNWGGGSRMNSCVNTTLYWETVRSAPGCENITRSDGRGNWWSGNRRNGFERERRWLGFHRPQFMWGNMQRAMTCLNQQFETRNAENETVVANVLRMFDAFIIPDKVANVTAAYTTCTNGTATLTRDQSLAAATCLMPALRNICA